MKGASTPFVLVCMLVGCGRWAFDPISGDAGPGGDVRDGGDAGDVAPCTQWSAFSAPTRIVELGAVTLDDWCPSISADDLEIFFYSARPSGTGSFDIWTSTRSSRTATWQPPTEVPGVSSTAFERVPWISSDGLTLGFSSLRAGGPGGYDLWWTTRATRTSAFGAPTLIPNVNTPLDDLASYLGGSGLRLYIVTLGAGGLDVYVAERATTTSAFGTPTVIGELSSPQNELSIGLSNDELEVFIASARTGSQGDDIYRATRPDVATPFSALVRVTELDSTMDDEHPRLSADGTALYYNYNAVTSGGFDSELWVSTRTCLAN